MNYELQDHTADVGVRATGGTLEEVFAAAASGLTAAQCDEVPSTGDRFDLTVRAESVEALLFDYLGELIYQRDVRSVLPTDHRVEITRSGELVLEASARGVPLDEVDAREVKAVTYSEMELEETPDGWTAYVVFDV